MLTELEINELQASEEYGNFVLDNYDPSDGYLICNGDTLLMAQEAGYLFAEFLMDRARRAILEPYKTG